MPYPPARPIVLHLHHFTKSLTLRLVIISFVAAWLARVLLWLQAHAVFRK